MARFDTLRLTVFEPAPAATLPVTCHAAPFPARWLRILQRQYQAATGRDRTWLPTRSLVELLDALDANIIHVSSRLADEAWIYAHAPVDREVVSVAVAAWAATEITAADPSLDWLDVLADDPVDWAPATLDLLACGRHPNGTARPEAQVFKLLPGHLAGLVTTTGLSLLDHDRSFILGPVDSSGRRSAVSWPAERIDDGAAGPGLWTPKIDFHVETVPGYGRPRVHADLTMTRFPLQPVTYVPRRGSKAAVTLWLRARDGFLRGAEQPTLLGARATRRFVNNQPRWVWDAGLSLALARLTQHRYPDPHDVLVAPDRYAHGPIGAYVVYSGGTKLAPPSLDDHDDEAENSDTPKVRSVQHAARVGFQPIDHLELYHQMAALLEPLGIVKAPELRRAKTRMPALLRPRDSLDQHYTLELWTQSPTTRQAILDTITRHLGFTPAPGSDGSGAVQPGIMRFTGAFALTVILRDIGALAAGIPRPAKGDKTATPADRIQQRLREIAGAVPRCADRRAAIVELQDAGYFARVRLDDPKPTIKQGFALANRRVQCLRPIREYTPTPNAKRPKRTLASTRFTIGDINRASAAVQDALRQLGRVGALTQPPGIPGPCELVGVWLEYVDGADVPLVIRIRTDGAATAQIATQDGAEELPYADLPIALSAGRGRLKRDRSTNPKARVAEFLAGVLGFDDARHDRVVFVRSASFRSRGWDWLQDQHVTPDLLVLPGCDPLDETVERLTPDKCPGLRIIRVRERGTSGEVPYGFGVEDDGDDFGRISGLFPFSELVFYGVNPRPSQNQVPKKLSKLDPTQAHNVQKSGSNPNPLEIVPVFLQDGDKRQDWAMYTQALRRAYLHTDIASQLPLPLHLASLADEYLV